MVKLKISSVKSAEDIGVVNELGVDYAGLVFYEDAGRVTGNIASHLVFDLRPEIDTVGMFKNHEAGEITVLLSAGIIDMVELCGNESEQYIENLKLRAETKVIKHFSVTKQSDVLVVNATKADIVSIKASELEKLGDVKKLITKPVIVRMDLTCEETAEILRGISAYAVDIMGENGKTDKLSAKKLQELILL